MLNPQRYSRNIWTCTLLSMLWILNCAQNTKLFFRDLPIASVAALLTISAVYALTNVAYFSVLSPEQLLESPAVALVRLTSPVCFVSWHHSWRNSAVRGSMNWQRRAFSRPGCRPRVNNTVVTAKMVTNLLSSISVVHTKCAGSSHWDTSFCRCGFILHGNREWLNDQRHSVSFFLKRTTKQIKQEQMPSLLGVVADTCLQLEGTLTRPNFVPWFTYTTSLPSYQFSSRWGFSTFYESPAEFFECPKANWSCSPFLGFCTLEVFCVQIWDLEFWPTHYFPRVWECLHPDSPLLRLEYQSVTAWCQVYSFWPTTAP